jgi:hypothetical protein
MHALPLSPQSMPDGELVTLPPALPTSDTVSHRSVAGEKVAVTPRVAFIVSRQTPVPLHAPLHPAKEEPLAGVGPPASRP